MTDAELDAINPGWREGIYKPLKITGRRMTEEEREADGDAVVADLIAVQYAAGAIAGAEFDRDNLDARHRNARVAGLRRRGGPRKAAKPVTPTPAPPKPIGERSLHPAWASIFAKKGIK